MTSALEIQIGGSHYKGRIHQPIELGMQNGYDPCLFSAFKYVDRHRRKNGYEDLRKAAHFVQLRQETLTPDMWGRHERPSGALTAARYVVENGLPPDDAAIIVLLDMWFFESYVGDEHGNEVPNDRLADLILDLIWKVAAETYPEQHYGEKADV